MPSKAVVDKPENEKADLPTPAVEKEAIVEKQPSQPAELKESSDTNEQENKSKENPEEEKDKDGEILASLNSVTENMDGK